MSELVATSQQGLVGKYQPYQEYKDSGVEWLGNVPSHWTVTAVKRFASFTTGWTPPTGNDAYFGGEHLWANISDIGHRVLSTTAKTITDAGVRATRIKKSPKGSLLFSFKLSIGLVSIVGEDMYTNEAIATFLPSETFNISYMYWAAPLFIPQNAEENIYGAKLLNQERIGNASFVLPTPKEQRAIAAFLDYETARIDRLIAQQQRLIELLKEKRQAVISHAVTKGLNPDAPMKDSGIEWLGQVPEHWVVTKLSRLVFMQEGPGLRTWQFTDEGTRVICVTNITESGIDFSRLQKYISTEEYMSSYRHFKVKQGDILISSSGNSWGKVAEYHGNNEVILNTSTIRVNVLSGNPLVRGFIKLYLQSVACREQLGLAMTGACQPNFGPSHLKEVFSPVPPQNEQNEIVRYITDATSTFARTIGVCEATVALLQERRSALISAAVTGKIDLRGWTPPAEEVAA
ncbi:restriction endonuclease subunit S [Aeromonas media]|uniref:restriction endonuclease subunit S n=1 Tax=Aeromonas media TaxID=651 RepID=UPI0002E4320D|nr:restriction endonuclease subunit S [Aeromonas media]AHX61100.1 type I restriction-modification system specificity subunit [Aeromonas media WS]